MKFFVLVFLTFVISSNGQTLTCPEDFDLVLDKCLQVNVKSDTDPYAEERCRYYGGTLVNIHNAVVNRAVAQYARNSFQQNVWIGLFCFGNGLTDCYYDDYSGALSTYSNFASGFPAVKSPNSGCVYMEVSGSQTGKWFTADCNSPDISFVCEVPASVQDPNPSQNCSSFNNYCYWQNSSPQSFTDALKTCQSQNATIVSIHSKQENDFLQILYTKTGNLVLGAKRVFPNSYGWADGSTWGDFDYRDPMDSGDNSFDCLGMDSSNTGLWSRLDCNLPSDFICKKPLPAKLDTSYCNSTLVMAPGVITSYGYPNNNSPPPCTWRIGTVGAYAVRITFTDVQNSVITVYDANGKNIGHVQKPQTILAPSNFITVVQLGGGRFKAQVLPD